MLVDNCLDSIKKLVNLSLYKINNDEEKEAVLSAIENDEELLFLLDIHTRDIALDATPINLLETNDSSAVVLKRINKDYFIRVPAYPKIGENIDIDDGLVYAVVYNVVCDLHDVFSYLKPKATQLVNSYKLAYINVLDDILNGNIEANNEFVNVRFSSDGEEWHDSFAPDDIYISFKRADTNEWTSSIRFVGKDGKNCSDTSILALQDVEDDSFEGKKKKTFIVNDDESGVFLDNTSLFDIKEVKELAVDDLSTLDKKLLYFYGGDDENEAGIYLLTFKELYDKGYIDLTDVKVTDLADTPNTLEANKILKVNNDATAIELISNSILNLDDIPTTFGEAGQVLAVNSDKTALEWSDVASGGATNFTDLEDTPDTLSEGYLLCDGESFTFSSISTSDLADFPSLGNENDVLSIDSDRNIVWTSLSSVNENNFTDLEDTPSDYSDAGSIAIVNSDEDGITFSDFTIDSLEWASYLSDGNFGDANTIAIVNNNKNGLNFSDFTIDSLEWASNSSKSFSSAHENEIAIVNSDGDGITFSDFTIDSLEWASNLYNIFIDDTDLRGKTIILNSTNDGFDFVDYYDHKKHTDIFYIDADDTTITLDINEYRKFYIYTNGVGDITIKTKSSNDDNSTNFIVGEKYTIYIACKNGDSATFSFGDETYGDATVVDGSTSDDTGITLNVFDIEEIMPSSDGKVIIKNKTVINNYNR